MAAMSHTLPLKSGEHWNVYRARTRWKNTRDRQAKTDCRHDLEGGKTKVIAPHNLSQDYDINRSPIRVA